MKSYTQKDDQVRVLVTGANGYLGKGIVKQLLDDGIQVVANDFSTTSVDPRAERINGNLFEITNPYEFFGHPKWLLHLAWRNGFVHNSKTHICDLLLHFEFLTKIAESGIKKTINTRDNA